MGSAPGGMSSLSRVDVDPQCVELLAAVFFATYDTLKHRLPLPVQLVPITHVISASVAEIVCASTCVHIGIYSTLCSCKAACVIRVPIEVIKTRSQTSVYGKGAVSSLVAARRTFETNGMRGFYQGFGITVAREVGSITFMTPPSILIASTHLDPI